MTSENQPQAGLPLDEPISDSLIAEPEPEPEKLAPELKLSEIFSKDVIAAVKYNPKSRFARHALCWRQAGFYPIPGTPANKQPLGFGKDELTALMENPESIDDKMILEWGKKHSEATVLLLTGHNLIVVDVDDPAKAKEAEADFGQPFFTVSTGRKEGAGHWYFRPRKPRVQGKDPKDSAIHSRIGIYGEKTVDIKGYHSYVVAPGSLHVGGNVRYRGSMVVSPDLLGSLPTISVSAVQRAGAQYREAADATRKETYEAGKPENWEILKNDPFVRWMETRAGDPGLCPGYDSWRGLSTNLIAALGEKAAHEHYLRISKMDDRPEKPTASEIERDFRKARKSVALAGPLTYDFLRMNGYSGEIPSYRAPCSIVGRVLRERNRKEKEKEGIAILPKADQLTISLDLVAWMGEDWVNWQGDWREWTGRAWEVVPDAQVTSMVMDRYAKAIVKDEEDQETPVFLSASAIEGIIRLAKAKRYRADFGRNGAYVAFQDGSWIEWTKEKGTVKHESKDVKPEDMILAEHVLPFPCPDMTNYKPPKLLLSILEKAWEGEADKDARVTFLREWLGVALLGQSTRMERHILAWGPPATGKSTILGALATMFPPSLCASVPLQDFSSQFRAFPLAFARINLVDDNQDRELLSTGPANAILTGKAPVQFERKHRQPIRITPTAGHLISLNTLPPVADRTGAFHRRWVVLTFDRVIPPGERKIGIQEELMMEAPSIVLWALVGGTRALTRGFYTLPSSSAEAISEWQERDDNVRQFEGECMELPKGKEQWETLTKVHLTYSDYARKNGGNPVGNRRLAGLLRDMGWRVKKSDKGIMVMCKLKPPFTEDIDPILEAAFPPSPKTMVLRALDEIPTPPENRKGTVETAYTMAEKEDWSTLLSCLRASVQEGTEGASEALARVEGILAGKGVARA